MKKWLWTVSAIALAIFNSGCSKSKGPSPEDTALIKGTDRGTFVGSMGEGFQDGEEELSPVGSTISAQDGSGDLIPQDSTWSDPSALANAEELFEPIFFGFDQYAIGPDERLKLLDVSAFMTSNPNSRILVEGYCDWKGTPAYNKSLGDRRASSVRDYLVDLGIDSSRIEILSFGDEQATPNADPTTSGLERKAQFLVLRDS
ncbi:MAG: OmpA family protein [Verrucomicrobiota bacterium]|nr:OmpA family protein [Verrucomicrobiota bacterium]